MHINYPLLIGGLIVSFLLIIVVLGPQIVPLDPYAMNFYEVIYENGKMIESKPQMPPNEINIWGTDTLGRDLFSQVIYGARITITLGFLIAIGRFFIALPFAYFAGFGGKISDRIINFFNKIFSTLPVLIVSFMILKFSMFQRLDLGKSIIAFTIVLTFVGWGRLANILKLRINDILNQEFIQGEIAIGKSKFLIALQNVLPHLTASIIINFFLEMSRALLLIGGLGIFSVYVGANKVPSDTIARMGLDFVPNYHPEWGGLLASGQYAIMVQKPWMAIYPASAFFISILGFNLLGEGFKIEVNKRTSMVITYIRRIPFYISPKTFIYEILNFKRNKLPVILKTGIIVSVIVIIILGNITPRSIYELDSVSILNTIEELSKDKYEGRMTGSKGRDEAADYIIGELKKYGVKPYFDEDYIKSVDSKVSVANINDAKLKLFNNDGKEQLTFDYITDFNLSNIYTKDEMYFNEKMIGDILTHNQYLQGDYEKKNRYFLVLDREKLMELPDYGYRNFFAEVSFNRSITGVIYPISGRESFDRKYTVLQAKEVKGSYLPHPILIHANENVVSELLRNKDLKIVLENDINIMENITVKNIGGIIEGKNSEGKDTIIITTNYDYYGRDGELLFKGLLYNGTSIASSLEMAKALGSLDEKPENDIVFLFFDASSLNRFTGAKMYINTDYTIFRNTYAFCMNDLGIVDSDKLFIDTAYGSTNQKEYFEYAKYIKKRAQELDIKLEQSRLINGREDIAAIMNGKGRGIYFKTVNDPYHKYYGTMQTDIDLINIESLKKQAQLILDTIIHIAYEK